MKMTAALMYGPGDIRVEQVEKPACPKGGFILKVMAVGLCGSDIRNLTSDSRKGGYPFIYGHEITGVVDEVDDELTQFKVGDRLYLFPGCYCMECDECIAGRSEYCTNVEKDVAGTGGFAQYVAVSARKVQLGGIYHIPEDVDFAVASLGEPLSTVYACLENINVGFGDTVVIIGAGPIGCFMAQLSKMRGADKVIMVEINEKRLRQAERFGVDYAINGSTEDPIAAVRKLTGGMGADKVISANPSTAGQAQSVYMTRKGGVAVFFGGVPKGSMAELDTNFIHYENIWIKGHFGCSYSQSKRAYELAISKDFPAERIITHVLPLEKIEEGIALTRSGEAIKVVLLPNQRA